MTNTKNGKVVSLDEFGREQTGFGPSAQTEILRACRSRVADQLGTFVEKMMDQVDDALFARAEKAESNTQQTHYFDAMREVRLKRADLPHGVKIEGLLERRCRHQPQRRQPGILPGRLGQPRRRRYGAGGAR